jgi:hypothetical protein
MVDQLVDQHSGQGRQLPHKLNQSSSGCADVRVSRLELLVFVHPFWNAAMRVRCGHSRESEEVRRVTDSQSVRVRVRVRMQHDVHWVSGLATAYFWSHALAVILACTLPCVRHAVTVSDSHWANQLPSWQTLNRDESCSGQANASASWDTKPPSASKAGQCFRSFCYLYIPLLFAWNASLQPLYAVLGTVIHFWSDKPKNRGHKVWIMIKSTFIEAICHAENFCHSDHLGPWI